MKRIKTSDISGTSMMPLKSGSIDFLQDSFSENDFNLFKAFLENTGISISNSFVLYGCVITVAGGNISITSGVVIHGGEIFEVLAGTVTNTSVGLRINESFFTAVNADPVTFTDSVGRNVHSIRKLEIASSLSLLIPINNLIRIPAITPIRTFANFSDFNGTSPMLVPLGLNRHILDKGTGNYTANALKIRLDGTNEQPIAGCYCDLTFFNDANMITLEFESQFANTTFVYEAGASVTSNVVNILGGKWVTVRVKLEGWITPPTAKHIVSVQIFIS